MTAPGSPNAEGKAAMIAVVGRANTGKSTLLNAILGEKVSIVSPVAQTTRNLVRGILTETRGQLVFLDTPGMHKAESDLGKIMNRTARASVEGVDRVLLVLDGSAPPREEDEGWMRKLRRTPDVPVTLLVNKCDLPTPYADAYLQAWRSIMGESAAGQAPDLRRISAATGEGLDALVSDLFADAPAGPPLFPEDVLTDFPRKLAIADVVREKYFHLLSQEVPHHLAVWIETLDDSDTPWKASGTIYVQRPGQKGIVIGEKARLIKKVRKQAESDLQEMYGVPIQLELWVKVDKHWARNFWILRQLGYA